MTDEPRLPLTPPLAHPLAQPPALILGETHRPALSDDQFRARIMGAIAPLLLDGGSDAMIGVRRLLQGVEDRFPGEVERMAARLQLLKAGVTPRAR